VHDYRPHRGERWTWGPDSYDVAGFTAQHRLLGALRQTSVLSIPKRLTVKVGRGRCARWQLPS
jgi:hypothetical protein